MKRNKKIYQLLFFIFLTFFGVTYMIIDSHTDKKDTVEILKEYTKPITIEESSNDEITEQEQEDSSNYLNKELPEGQPDENLKPEMYGGTSE